MRSASPGPSVLYLWPGRFLLCTRDVRNRPHRHLACSILIGLERSFHLGIGRKTLRNLRGALVAPNVLQSLDSQRGAMLIAHLDPDLALYRRFAARLHGHSHEVLAERRLEPLLGQLKAASAQEPDCALGAQLFQQLVDVAATGVEPLPLDPRIASLTERLRTELPEKPEPAEWAAAMGLSESRLMHLFKQQLGVPLSRFLLSLKVQRASLNYRAGMTLADLALDAGFYDQPHLVRTARAMFDTLPSHLAAPALMRVLVCDARV